MLRKSLRLQEANYYTNEQRPFISYKERLNRIFRRRRRQRGCCLSLKLLADYPVDDEYMGFKPTERASQPWAHSWTDEQNETQSSKPRRNRNPANSSFPVRGVCCFIIMLLLALGFTHRYFEPRVVENEHLVSGQLQLCFSVDDTMPNFALHTKGAKIIKERSSNTYPPKTCNIFTKIFCCWYEEEIENRVIQGQSELLAGDCWCFPGDHGYLVISLSDPVSITHVTIGHITKSQSPNGQIESAPREFSINGMTSAEDEGTCLGIAVYNEDGAGFQTFELHNPDSRVFSHLLIKIHSNYGNSEYSCLYSVRVYGKHTVSP